MADGVGKIVVPAKTPAVLHSPCDGAKEVLPSDSDCSSDGATADVTSAAERINCLLQVTAERDLLFAQNQMLCGANEKLVLATIEAQTLRDEAEAANHRQNEFLAMLAHELRNPLAPISMAGAMLGKIPGASPHLLGVQKVIERQVDHLSRLLDDLLDAARINSGKITLVRSPLLLAEQLVNAIQTVQMRLDERRQRVRFHVPSANIMLYGDPVRLEQVFSNLLVNASKFTQDGGQIVLSAWVEDETVTITFADNGAGISTEVLPNIFSLFTQGPRSLARSEGGLGVGLNVVRNVVELHGGSVEASSPGLGLGSVFTLRFPLLKPDASCCPLTSPEAPQTGLSQRILLIEDNLDSINMLSMCLRAEGHTVETAFDGPTGLATATAQDFDVLVCDIGLPGMNGYDLMKSIGTTPGGKTPFAIAVSGYGQVEDRSRAFAVGFKHYMVKPIDIDALLKLIVST